MKFPLLNISSNHWTGEDDPTLFLLHTPYINTPDKDLFTTYFLNQRYVDTKGDIYVIIGRRKPKSFLRKFLKFLPNVYQVGLLFEETGTQMAFDEVKKYLLNKISFYTPNEDLTRWIEKVRLAKNFDELLT